MKKIVCLVFMALLVSALFAQYPIQFFIETDNETYEYGQPIHITYFLYNPNSEPVDLDFPCLNPFYYSIDDVLCDGVCLPMVWSITIQSYSCYTESTTHTDTLNVGNHIIYGILKDWENDIYTSDVCFNVLQTDNDIIPDYSINLNNYPNPFNPATTIQFELAEAGEATLEILNIKGQKVKTLSNEFLPIGKHERIWDGKDENHQPVSSGIYFCKLRSSKYSAYRKMILLK